MIFEHTKIRSNVEGHLLVDAGVVAVVGVVAHTVVVTPVFPSFFLFVRLTFVLTVACNRRTVLAEIFFRFYYNRIT